MIVFVYDHHGKAAPLAAALAARGHTINGHGVGADLILIDRDTYPAGPCRAILDRAHDDGVPVVVYPHQADHVPFYLTQDPHPATRALLVTSPGAKRLEESYRHSRPVINVGWYLCPLVPFHVPLGRERISILFAPDHGPGSQNTPVRLALSYDGIAVTERVALAAAPDWGQIDAHDVVIATGTYAMLALARGKPVVMFSQPTPEPYPLDIAFGGAGALIRLALAGKGCEWRDGFVGAAWDADAFVSVLEEVAA